MRLLKKKQLKRWFAMPKLTVLIVSFMVLTLLLIAFLNQRLTPTYLEYAEVQTTKIASMVISKAINARIANVLDVNEIIEHVPGDQDSMVTTRFNTEIINRVLSDTNRLVQSHLEQAESGDLSDLPYLKDVEYDLESMQEEGGVVFFVPLAQAANLPIIGNLGPKIPIRFHVIGNVQSTVDSSIREFGINNAYVEVNILLKVNVQVIVPLASRVTTVEQKIPVAMGLIQGQVPQIYNSGEGSGPSVEVPLSPPSK